jgi:hypothetical protein
MSCSFETPTWLPRIRITNGPRVFSSTPKMQTRLNVGATSCHVNAKCGAARFSRGSESSHPSPVRIPRPTRFLKFEMVKPRARNTLGGESRHRAASKEREIMIEPSSPLESEA